MRTLGVGVALLAWACAFAPTAWADDYSYDALGRLVAHRAADGKLTTYAYDAAGNRTTVATTASAANQAPNAVDDVRTWNEGSAALTFDPRSNDTDPNGGTPTVIGSTTADFGVATRTTSSVTWTPGPNANRLSARDVFTYTIQDGGGLSDSAVVTVDLTNLAPIAVTDTLTVPRNQPTTFDPRGNDTDAGGDPLSIIAHTNPSQGAATHTATSVTYTPPTAYSGPATLTYTINDGDGASAVGTINLTVSGGNQSPIANPDNTSAIWDQTTTFDPRLNDTDPDGDPLVITNVGAASHGNAVIAMPAGVEYTAFSGYIGQDTFTYTISDGRGGTATATVFVNIDSGF